MNKNILWLSAVALSISVNQATIACSCTHKAHSKKHVNNQVSEQDLAKNKKEEKIIGVR